MNQFDFFKRFPTENDAIDFIVETKYKDGYVCPKCGCVHRKIYHQRYSHRNLYCKNCKSEFSALKGTIFEHTHLGIRMWLFAINLVLIARKGISGLQLQRELGMNSYKGAFRMLKLIRAANREKRTHTKARQPKKASVAGVRAKHPLLGFLSAIAAGFTPSSLCRTKRVRS